MSILSIVMMFLFAITFMAIQYLWVLIDDLTKMRGWNVQQLRAEVDRLKRIAPDDQEEKEHEVGIRVILSRYRAIEILNEQEPFHVDHLTSNETLAAEIQNRKLYPGTRIQVIGEAPAS